MKKIIEKTLAIALCFIFLIGTIDGQLTNQLYSTGVAGGISNGPTLSTEISTGMIGGISRNENFEIYLGLTSFNIKSALVTVQSRSEGNAISDEVVGTLLSVQENGLYDTMGIVSSPNGDFTFNSVFLGDYIVNVDSDPNKYVATYYGNSVLWEQADILSLSKDSVIQIEVEPKPDDRNETTGEGVVSGTIEENFEDENGRIDARRRAAKRKCGLRKKTGGGRTGADEDGFELIAYGETNENGEFEYDFLPEGTYRFFVEYPGIPLDESSFVEFDIGKAGVSDNTFVLAAVVTEKGIFIEIILGITSDFFTNFQVYPNPTVNVINIRYDEIKSESIRLDLIDMNGKIQLSRADLKNEDKSLQLDLSSFNSGQYLLRFIDTTSSEGVLTFRILKK